MVKLSSCKIHLLNFLAFLFHPFILTFHRRNFFEKRKMHLSTKTRGRHPWLIENSIRNVKRKMFLMMRTKKTNDWKMFLKGRFFCSIESFAYWSQNIFQLPQTQWTIISTRQLEIYNPPNAWVRMRMKSSEIV